ncbi:MAG: DUF6512 family protein [Anaerovoracaceae bacterium]
MIYLTQLFGTAFTVLLGILLRFIYDWSGESRLVALIAPAGDSPAEKEKMLATPFLLWTMIQYVHFGQTVSGFLPAKFLALLSGGLFFLFSFRLVPRLRPLFGLPSSTLDLLLLLPASALTFALDSALLKIFF